MRHVMFANPNQEKKTIIKQWQDYAIAQIVI